MGTPSGFHPLTVAAVERLCDDAVAVTFEVPDDLRALYEFRPGQYLTLRQATPVARNAARTRSAPRRAGPRGSGSAASTVVCSPSGWSTASKRVTASRSGHRTAVSPRTSRRAPIMG